MAILLMIASVWPQFMHDAQHTGRSPVVVPDSLQISWIYDHPGGISWTWAQPVLDDEGNIYYGSGSYFVSVDTGGNLRWSKQTAHVFGGPAAVVGDTVYFACSEGYLAACDLNGTEFWRFPLVHPVNGGPMVGEDGTIYIGDVSSQPNQAVLYAINPDGSQKWSADFDSSDGCYTTPALDRDGKQVYITPGNWYLHAVDAVNGSKIWRYRSSAAFNIQYSSPSVLGSMIFFGDLGNLSGYAYWYCIGKDGSLKWRIQTANSIQNTASFGLDNTIYFGDNDGVLRAVDTLGNLKWQRSFGCDISDPVVDANNRILIGTEGGYLYLLDGSSGSIIQQIYLSHGNLSTPIPGPDGQVYVIGGGGDLICLKGKIGIQEGRNQKHPGIVVRPNPSSDRFRIITPPGARIRIYEPTGRLIHTAISRGEVVWHPLKGYGVYFLEVDGHQQKLIYLRR